jgi:hypothetical protein
VATFRRYHLSIAGGLFLIAFLFYFAGIASGAIAFSLLGAIVEVVAWIAMFLEGPEQSPGSKTSSGERG